MCKFIHAHFSFDLSTNYAKRDLTAENNGGRLPERLRFQRNNFGYSERNGTV